MPDEKKKKPTILMVGTALEAKGGIASVVDVLKQAGLFERCGIEYVVSHRDGSAAVKLLAALRGWGRFLFRLGSRRISLLHVHMSSRASFWRKLLFILPVRLFDVPYVLHLHGGEFKIFYGDESSPLVQRLISSVFTHAGCVIVLSEDWKVWVARQFPQANVEIIHNPVFIPKEETSGSDRQLVLFLGRISEKKGAHDLIRAFAKISATHPRGRLLMAGDGDLSGAAKLAAELCISDRIELPGWLRGADKAAALANAGIYALPSYYECLPMGVLEAMAVGLPIVATPVGGIPEAVVDGTEGFLVPPGNIEKLTDRISRLLEDAALRQAMGHAARQRAEAMFSVEHILPKFEAIYAKLDSRFSLGANPIREQGDPDK
ncbi:MAG TPA: glycosyltransferase family 4 protein [Candidatus Desulfobacillus sp.]|nr:glycosyltransferase family 4 protein [Candidatus Desulfobacillus sp.]